MICLKKKKACIWLIQVLWCDFNVCFVQINKLRHFHKLTIVRKRFLQFLRFACAGEEEEGRRSPARRRGSRERAAGDKNRGERESGARAAWSEAQGVGSGSAGGGSAGGVGGGADREREAGWGGWSETGAGSGQSGREPSGGWGGWTEGSGAGPTSSGGGGEGAAAGSVARPKGAFFHVPVGERRYRRPEKSDQPAQGGGRGGAVSPTPTPASEGSPPPSAGSDQV